ncbi:MAG TPA: hypothetical protein VMF69_19565 [Gemmataceae bacterium]|nr:hypothetical protein [Gemmataceae bacterium]
MFYFNQRETEKDGSYRIPALPGRGLIAVRAFQDHYVRGVGAERIKNASPARTRGMFNTVPKPCFAENYHALAEISPTSGVESIVCDLTLDPGRSLKGTVLDPDGKPLAGARVAGLKDIGYWEFNPLAGADFTVECLTPNKPRLLQFRHEGKKLAAALVLRGDRKEPLRVRLEPWATLTGRLLTPEGEPMTGVWVHCWTDVKPDGSTYYERLQRVQPGKDGRFRIEGLAPGSKYELSVTKGSLKLDIAGGNPQRLKIKAHRTKDLGDLRVKPAK